MLRELAGISGTQNFRECTSITIQQLIAAAEHAARYVPTVTAQPILELAQVCQQLADRNVIDPRSAVRAEHAAWSQSTFGTFGPVGPLKHLAKKAMEAAVVPDDMSEWADCQLLLWDAQCRAGITDEQIAAACVEKLTVNKHRLWPAPKDDESQHHIKTDENAINACRRRNCKSKAREG